MELGKRRLGKEGGNVINVYKYLNWGCKEDEASFFSVVSSARIRGHIHKLEHSIF